MANFLNSILDTHPDLICRYDENLHLVFINIACAKFFGGVPADFTGRNFVEFVNKDSVSAAKDLLSNISIENPKNTSRQKFILPDGQTKWIFWTNIGLYNVDKTLQGYQSVGRDITVEMELSKEAALQNKALSSVRSELRAVIDAVPSMIWYKDDKNKILHLNKSAAKSMGGDVSEFQGKNTYDLFGDGARKYHEDDLKVIHSGKPYIGIVERFTPNEGEALWVQTDKIPFNNVDEDGQRILVVSTDITEIKEKEALLQTINKNLDDFTSLTSHDLKAPLRKIGLSAELLKLELGPNMSTEARVNVDDILDGVQHMQTLIESFLKFMKSSPEEVELETLSLNEVFSHAYKRIDTELDEIGAEITFPEFDMFVKGDFALLGQVFGNLFENAIKYRHPERPLRINVMAQSRSRMWEVTIRDNGTGIEPNASENIFELFGRAKRHLGVEGSGIGLALCKRIITLHGGTIECLPMQDAGSAFKLTFNQCGRQSYGKSISR